MLVEGGVISTFIFIIMVGGVKRKQGGRYKSDKGCSRGVHKMDLSIAITRGWRVKLIGGVTHN